MADAVLDVELRARDQASGPIKNLGEAGTKTGTKLKRSLIPELIKTAAILGAIKIAAKAVTSVIKGLTFGYSGLGDQIGKTSRILGISVEELSELRAVGILASITFEEMITAARKLNQNMAILGAGQATTELEIAFTTLRRNVEDLRGKSLSTIEAMTLFADSFKEVGKSSERTSAAIAIFGRAGAKMIPLLEQGTAEIARQIQMLRELGVIMSEEAATKAEEFETNVAILQLTLEGVRNEIGAELVPAMSDLIIKFLEWFKTIRTEVSQTIRFIPTAFELMIKFVEHVIRTGQIPELFREIMGKVSELVAVGAEMLWEPLFGSFRKTGIKILVWFQENVANEIFDIINKARLHFKPQLRVDLQAFEELKGELADLQKTAQHVAQGIAPVIEGLVIDPIRAIEIEEDELKRRIAQLQVDLVRQAQRIEEQGGAVLVKPFAMADDEVETLNDHLSRTQEALKGVNLELTTSTGEVSMLKRFQLGLLALWRMTGKEVREVKEELPEVTKEVSKWAQFMGADPITGQIVEGQGFLGALQEMETGLSRIADQGKRVAEGIIKSVSDAIDQSFFRLMEDKIRSLKDAAKAFFADLARGLAQLAAQEARNELLLQIIKGIKSVVPSGTAAAAQGGVIGGAMGAPVKAYQHGGIAEGPTVAVFGEGRGAEAFVPLGPSRRIPVELKGDAGRNVNVSFSVHAVDAQSFRGLVWTEQQLFKNMIREAINTDTDFKRQVRA